MKHIACNRCFTKKRKCNGDYVLKSRCRNCRNADVSCEYNPKRFPDYIERLEQRINYLENLLPTNICHNLIFDLDNLNGDNSPNGNNSSDIITNDATDLGSHFKYVEIYFNNYFNGIHQRYPFLIKSKLKSLHDDLVNFKRFNNIDKFLILMCYAIGSSNSVTQKWFYKYAMSLNLNDTPHEVIPIFKIHSLLLLVIYQLNRSKMSNVWLLITNTLQLCINLNLHRTNLNKFRTNPIEYTVGVRTFWSTYCLERIISNSSNKPFSLNDNDIDVDFPIDIDEIINDTTIIKSLFYKTYPHHNLENFTIDHNVAIERNSNSLSILHFKYRSIESKIISTIYRIDRNFSSINTDSIISLKNSIDNWKLLLPSYLSTNEVNYWDYMYNKLLRLLIQPFLISLSGKSLLLKCCVNSCIKICKFSEIIHNELGKITFVSLITIFLSGINLIYCILSKKTAPTIEINYSLNNVRVFLYLVSKNSPNCKIFKTIFDNLLNKLSSGEFNLTDFPIQFFGFNLDSSLDNFPTVDLLFGQTILKQLQIDPDEIIEENISQNGEQQQEIIPQESLQETFVEANFNFDEIIENFANVESFKMDLGIDL